MQEEEGSGVTDQVGERGLARPARDDEAHRPDSEIPEKGYTHHNVDKDQTRLQHIGPFERKPNHREKHHGRKCATQEEGCKVGIIAKRECLEDQCIPSWPIIEHVSLLRVTPAHAYEADT